MSTPPPVFPPGQVGSLVISMELDRLRADEIIIVAEIVKLLGTTDDVDEMGRRIRILDACLLTYRRLLAELRGTHG